MVFPSRNRRIWLQCRWVPGETETCFNRCTLSPALKSLPLITRKLSEASPGTLEVTPTKISLPPPPTPLLPSFNIMQKRMPSAERSKYLRAGIKKWVREANLIHMRRLGHAAVCGLCFHLDFSFSTGHIASLFLHLLGCFSEQFHDWHYHIL